MKKETEIWRDENGVPHVEAADTNGMYWGQGYVHAMDRGTQVLLMRILGQGRASELLDSSDDTLEIDKFFRRMDWSGNIKAQLDKLSEQDEQYLDSYCDGINAGFSKRYPWEMKLAGCSYEKWGKEDCLMISRMIGYLTLAQSQLEAERLLVELVQAGVSKEKLDELFPNILGELDIPLLQKVKLHERIVPSKLLWNTAAPRMTASNNWALSGKKTASGKPLISNDPHLEVNRLPNVWCEIVLKAKGRYAAGVSMPGVPGVIIGRNSDLAWTVTYSFMDSADSWVEKCEDGKYYREEENQWIEFRRRKEIIKRKRKAAAELTFYENNHGTLEGDPYEKGYYLASKWACSESGAASFSAIFKIPEAESVEEGMNILGKLETGWNFMFADSKGDIGYQMSGLSPIRRKGIDGFVPLPGWKKENDWQGFFSHEEMPRIKNPEEGYFTTANQNLNHYGVANPINMPMAPYRSDRIGQILAQGKNLSASDMFDMHFDVYSLQAEYFMKILKPLLPDTPQGEILANWDLRYDADSKGAFLFERFYKELYRRVFGENGFGEAAIDYLDEETGVFIDFYDNFDRILLSETSLWFGEKSRDEIFRQAAAIALDVKPLIWGETRKVVMSHILFGGKLPSFLGFDRGPITLIGGRATINQGQIYRSGGRQTSFSPSFRMVADMSEDDLFTNLAGGPSDRRFSKWYCSDLKNWISGKYKTVSPKGGRKKLSF